VEPTIFRICVRACIRQQRVAMTVHDLAALITVERRGHNTNWRSRMKRRRIQRPRAGYGTGAARTRRLFRTCDAAASARRSTHRRGTDATDTVPAIEAQLHALRPIRSAQRVPTGIACGAPAVAAAEIHAIDECNQMGLSPDGDLVETLCQACLATVQLAMATYVGHKRDMASRCGAHPVCPTCGRPIKYLHNLLAVRPIECEGPAS
jgi:hypothetical protein